MDKHNLELALDLRHLLHANPELSNREQKTKKRLISFLKKHSALEIRDRGKWFYAAYRSGSIGRSGPAIAFRADMDAVAMAESIELPWASKVPGVAHKCGHDGHCATLAAFGLELERQRPARDVLLIFQHAEETGAGAAECLEDLRAENIAEIYAFHNMPGQKYGTIGLRDSNMCCASLGLILEFTGRESHASLPEHGRNPAQALAECISILPELTSSADFSGRVWCTVIQASLGSGNFGIAAGQGKLLLTCRAEREDNLLTLAQAIEQNARRLAERDELTLSIRHEDVFPETVNNAACAEKLRRSCAKNGIPVLELPEPMRASEDVGHFFKRIPGALFLFHTGERPPIHSPEFDFDDTIIEAVVELYKTLV